MHCESPDKPSRSGIPPNSGAIVFLLYSGVDGDPLRLKETR